MFVTLFLMTLAWFSPQAQEPPPSSAQNPPVIVIPPAVTGLSAAPSELQQALDESVLPRSVPELLAELAKRAGDIERTIASGAFGQVWVPAMGTKTVALVLESRTSDLPEARRAAATAATKE